MSHSAAAPHLSHEPPLHLYHIRYNVCLTSHQDHPSAMAQPRSNNHRVAPAQRPRVETNHAALQNPRYSYLETPVEMQRSQFQQFSSPTNSAIDESPMSPPESLPNFSPAAPVNPVYEPDKHPGCPPTPRKDAHPAFYAPYAEDATMRQSNPRIPHGMVQPPDAHAAKTPNGLMKVESKQNGQPNGHRPTNGVTSPKPIYNPDSLGGPNFGAENHFPGQASHPNAHRDPEWKHGLCEPSAVCCMGILCPCVLYGKTQYRITKKTNKDDATDMLGYESVNGSCGLMGLACGLQCMYCTTFLL